MIMVMRLGAAAALSGRDILGRAGTPRERVCVARRRVEREAKLVYGQVARVGGRLGHVQVDNQLPSAVFPVRLPPSWSQEQQAKGQAARPPALELRMCRPATTQPRRGSQ